MNHIFRTSIAPMDAGCDLRAAFTGTGGDIPIVSLGFDPNWHDHATVEIALGNHPDPVDWLYTAAARLTQLADQIAASAALPGDIEQGEVSA